MVDFDVTNKVMSDFMSLKFLTNTFSQENAIDSQAQSGCLIIIIILHVVVRIDVVVLIVEAEVFIIVVVGVIKLRLCLINRPIEILYYINYF